MSLEWVIETHKEVQSTQDLVKQAAYDYQPEGLVIHALSQLDGRGRHGRTWVSVEGNLFLSVLLRPACRASVIGQLSLIIGLCLVEAIEQHSNDNLNNRLILKWPNDLLLDNQKCAGILLESELSANGDVEWLVLGVGLNVISAPDDLGIALDGVLNQGVGIDDVRDSFLKYLAQSYQNWLLSGFETYRRAWLSQSYKVGHPVHVKVGERLEKGAFHDIDMNGHLRIMDNGQIKMITAGEVYF
ncbi:MAG: biotin--[acetyl-CoA-carboxylase] ligase [Bdellovibrionales bacterium]